MKICIYGAASARIESKYILKGEELGKIIAENNNTVVFGGGASGMMGAVARGAKTANGEIIGIAPSFFDVDGVLFDGCTELIYTETMRERKQMLEDYADAFLITPGGIGTFDEAFETLTLRQLCAHRKPVAFYNIHGYYDNMIAMLEHAISEKFIAPENRAIYFVSSDPQEIMNYFKTYNPENTEPQKFRGAK